MLSEKVTQLEEKNTYVQIGSDRQVTMSKPVTEEENLNLFVRESLPLLYTISAYAPKEFDPDCLHNESCAQHLSKGVEVEGVGNVPPIPAVASYLLSVDYQKPFLRSLVQLKPKNYDRGASLIYRVSGVGEPKPLNDGQLEIYVTGALFGFDLENKPLLGMRDDKIITVQQVTSPLDSDETTQLHTTVTATRERGWEISQIVSVENEPEEKP